MSLLNNGTTSEATLEQKKQRTANNISISCKNLFGQMISIYNRNMELVWNNPQGLTPQQVLDAVGTDAKELFTLAGNLRTLVNNAKPGTLPEPTLPNLRFGQDGTCTIVE